MGTFARYTGSMNIPEQDFETFTEQMIKILNYGGMMDIETVSMYGHKLPLLKPVEIVPGGSVSFYYNYFEDNNWESAGYDAEECRLWTNKIGSFEFDYVILAAYILYELYDDDMGYTLLNGELIDSYPFVRWFNHLLGTNFSMEKYRNLWERMEAIALYRVEEDYPPDSVMDLIPHSLLAYAGGTDFTDICYIEKGTESLTEDQVVPGSYPADVLACKKCITEYTSDGKDKARVDKLYSLVCKDRDSRKLINDPKIKEIAEWSLILPARTIVYLTTEITKEDFWIRWIEHRDCVYHDEEMKLYADDKLQNLREIEWQKPVRGMRTSDFLIEDDYFVFYDTPDELRNKPKYYVSDADRLYWWDGTDEVIISEETDLWIKGLAERHKTIAKTMKPEKGQDSDSFMRDFFSLLYEIDEKYKRIIPFQKMFYDFISNSHRKKYRAAVSLLKELSDENWEEGKAIRFLKHNWDLTSRKVTFNPGRLNIKRYMSILANIPLRKKYFGF